MNYHKSRVSGRACGGRLPLLLALAGTCGVAFAAEPAMRDGGGSDAALKAKVQAALSSDKNLYAQHIEVTVKDGVVHLGGFVASDRELQQAKQDAAAVAGVRNVASEMTLKPGSAESNTSGG